MRRYGSLLLGTAAVCLLLATGSGSWAQSEDEPFGLTDYDKDARIDRKEYQKRMVEVFYFADRNKDGVVTIEELAVIETVDEAGFRAADKNGDGKLTVEEFVAYRVIDFDAADQNHDGVLSYEEVQAWTASAP